MQLFIILALLLYGGNASAQNLLEEVKPVIEELGGEEARKALKSAEEISKVLTAVKAFSSAAAPVKPAPQPAVADNAENFFPLAPVSGIAGREITYALSQFVSEG